MPYSDAEPLSDLLVPSLLSLIDNGSPSPMPSEAPTREHAAAAAAHC